MGKSGLSEEAKELRREYLRNWQRKNREKVRAAQERYWEKKAREMRSAAEAEEES